MKAKISVHHGVKFPVKAYTISEESASIEIEVDCPEDQLDAQYEKWQKYIQEKVVKSVFIGANNFLEEQNKLKE